MTDERLVRSLAIALDDLAAARTPDYLEAAIERASSRPQRPRWTFPERWLPMDIATERVPMARLPMRALGVLALVGILIALGIAAYIGAQPRLPEPFGPAANGLIAYSSSGDIFASDQAGLDVRQLTSGPDLDTDPLYSPDGQQLAFLRTMGLDRYDLMVVASGGGEPVTVSTSQLESSDVFEWAPDGLWLLIATSDKELLRIDAVTPAEPTLIATDAVLPPLSSAFRPPDGREIMFLRESVGGLWVIDADGSDPRMIIDNPEPEDRDFAYARWSPDGATIAFPATVGDGEQYRIFEANADGSGLRRLSTADGIWVESDVRWSPDGRQIAFNHWLKDLTTSQFGVRPIGVLSVETGVMTEVGNIGSPDGTLLEWSPDGTSLIVVPGALAAPGGPSTGSASIIDVATGEVVDLPWDVQTRVGWQRKAP